MPIDPDTGKFLPAPEQRTLPAADDPAELDEAAKVTGEDVDRGAAYWRAKSPPWAAGLVDAKPYRPDESTGS